MRGPLAGGAGCGQFWSRAAAVHCCRSVEFGRSFFAGVCIIRADCIDESTVDGVEQIRSIGWPLSGHVCACVCVPIVSVRTGLEEMSVRLTHIHNFSLHKIGPIWRSVDMAMRLNDTLYFGWTDGPGRLMECEPRELNVY